MKRFYFPMFAVAMIFATSSCSKDETIIDEDPVPEAPGQPGGDTEPVSYGAFLVNAGNLYSNIEGSLSYWEYGSQNLFEDVFSSANSGQTVGDIFNAGYILDDKIYLAVTNSAVLHVINRDDFKIVKSISTVSNAGPRHITSLNGKIYMTLFGQPGYVAEVDPETLEITREVEVGPLPEYIVPFQGKLYVSVSDGRGDGSEASVTVIDPETFTVSQKITGIVNPVNLVTNGNQIFVCAWGQYMNEPPYSQYNYGLFEVKGNQFSEKLADATEICLNGNRLYYISAPYGLDTKKYGVYDTTNGSDNVWISEADGVDSPIAICTDPVTGDVFLISYRLGEAGYPSYTSPGYVKQYTETGRFVTTFDTGVSPVTMFFNVY